MIFRSILVVWVCVCVVLWAAPEGCGAAAEESWFPLTSSTEPALGVANSAAATGIFGLIHAFRIAGDRLVTGHTPQDVPVRPSASSLNQSLGSLEPVIGVHTYGPQCVEFCLQDAFKSTSGS